MIAFEELVAALDRWRVRNGLPVVTGDVPTAAVAAPAPAAAWSPPAAPAWAAAAPATAAPRAPVGEQSDVLSLGEDDVVEDEYDNEGADFAMGFDGAAVDPESTASGPAPTAPPPAMPEYADPAAPYDPYAAQSGSGPYEQAPASGPYVQPADPYAQAGSGGYAAVGTESDPAYDDPAYDPPIGDDGAYAPPTGDTIDADADADVIEEEATVVGDELPKR